MGGPSNWLTVICIDPATFGADTEAVRQHPESRNIEAGPAWKPMHPQPVFAATPTVSGDMAAEIFASDLSLPSDSALSDDACHQVVEELTTTPRHATLSHTAWGPPA